MKKNNTATRQVATSLFAIGSLGLLAYLCVLMFRIVLSYVPWTDTTGFLVLKQDWVTLPWWKLAFQVHVFASGFVLLAGFTQFFKRLRHKASLMGSLHICFGRLYVLVVLLLAAPSGLVLAVTAAGGWIVKLSFLLLTMLWVVFTWVAWRKARLKQWQAHAKFMIRSYALALSALSLRVWKLALYDLSVYWQWLTPLRIYQIESVLAWTLNLLVAEFIIWYIFKRIKAVSAF